MNQRSQAQVIQISTKIQAVILGKKGLQIRGLSTRLKNWETRPIPLPMTCQKTRFLNKVQKRKDLYFWGSFLLCSLSRSCVSAMLLDISTIVFSSSFAAGNATLNWLRLTGTKKRTKLISFRKLSIGTRPRPSLSICYQRHWLGEF